MRTVPHDPIRRVSPVRAAVVVLLAATATSACGDRSGKTLDEPIFPPPETTTTTTSVPDQPLAPAPEPAPMSLVAAWVDDTEIPERHTCRDVGLPPALSWADVPPGAVELALTVTDLDRGGHVHWLVYGIPVTETGSPEGGAPAGGFEWVGSAGVAGWEPPCPPPGETHRYRVTVHALNQQLEAADDADAREVISIIDAITIDRASTIGRVTGS